MSEKAKALIEATLQGKQPSVLVEQELGLPFAKLPTLGDLLYVEPAPGNAKRNCDNCMMWVRTNKCVIHSKSKAIQAKDVCGYHVYGQPMEEWMDHPGMQPVNPKYSGLTHVEEGTHCGNCMHFSGDRCTAAKTDKGTSHPPVDVNGCCARWEGYAQ
jgi:hypothetical protein